jgi:hypothetical protein
MRNVLVASTLALTVGLGACTHERTPGFTQTKLQACSDDASKPRRGFKSDPEFPICKYLEKREIASIEAAYATSATQSKQTFRHWVSPGQTTYYVSVDRPYPAEKAGCVHINATLAVGDAGASPLPPELYCQASNGIWLPFEAE